MANIGEVETTALEIIALSEAKLEDAPDQLASLAAAWAAKAKLLGLTKDACVRAFTISWDAVTVGQATGR